MSAKKSLLSKYSTVQYIRKGPLKNFQVELVELYTNNRNVGYLYEKNTQLNSVQLHPRTATQFFARLLEGLYRLTCSRKLERNRL